MPVQLDWEIEDIDAPLPGGGAAREARAGGCRRWLRLGLVVALLVAIGLGYLGYKLRQKKKEDEDRLRAVVQLELQALVENDRELFLNHQDFGSQRWRLYQERFFEDYHGQSDSAASFVYTGQVLDVHIEGHEAWALVEAARGESVWREMWFYHWSKDEGWRHSRPTADSLGDEQEYTTPHLRFVAPKLDGELVVNLGQEMEAWYEALLPMFDLDALDAPLTVEFTYRDPSRPDSTSTQWDQSRPYTLLAPSPHLGRFVADDAPSPELRQQMAGYLANALIAQQAGLPPDAKLPVELNALRHELRDWTVARLARKLPDSDQWTTRQAPLVEVLVAREGAGVVPLLAAALEGPETLHQALAEAQLDLPDPAAYFLFLLVADQRALYDLNPEDYGALFYTEADKGWRDYRASLFNSRLDDSYGVWSDTLWTPLQVKSVVFNDDIAWVEAEGAWPEDLIVRQVHFFQRVHAPGGERWLLTSPDPLYFGERRETRTANLIFSYFERDAQWYDEAVPERLQAVFAQAASDLGISTDNLSVTLEIHQQFQYGRYAGWPHSRLVSPSPRIMGWSGDGIDNIVLQHASFLIDLLPATGAPDWMVNVPNTIIPRSISEWELDRLFPTRERLVWFPVNASKVMDLSLDDLWVGSTSGFATQEWLLLSTASRTLVEYLAETYGPGVVSLLLDNLAQSGDVDQWLRASTRQGADEIEPAWRSWVWETYGTHESE
jgi:hypothetical protein